MAELDQKNNIRGTRLGTQTISRISQLEYSGFRQTQAKGEIGGNKCATGQIRGLETTFQVKFEWNGNENCEAVVLLINSLKNLQSE